MSTTAIAGAREPKRQRGRIRVAAIMDAAIAVFKEKGYDAATMTEIAARSGTAIGSLYRFFPTKEALADALLRQYTQHALDGLADLRARAGGMALDELAGYPKVVVEHRRFIDLGSVVTSAGISSGLDMSLHLVERFFGTELAEEVAHRMEYTRRAGDEV